MDDEQGGRSGDDLLMEVSSVRAPRRGDVGVADASRRSPLDPRRRGRRIFQLAGIVAALVLAVATVLASMPSAREVAAGLLTRPSPTATLAPNVTSFYMLPNPPGVTVWLDGMPLARAPLPGTRPLKLARGHHILRWLPGAFPFASLWCFFSVPRDAQDNCPIVPGYVLPMALLPAGGPDALPSVIDVRESLTTLPADEAMALTSVIQQALDASAASTTIEPGERYFTYAPGIPGHAVVATEPLRATMTLRLDDPGALNGCVLTPGAIQPCRAPGQDCSEICSLSNVSAGSGTVWLAGALVSSYWSYTTLDGRPVAERIGALGLNAHIVVLLISWDGADWHVTPLIGHHSAEQPATDDLLCDTARNWLAQGPLSTIFQLSSARSGGQVTVGYASDTVVTDGCAVRIAGYDQTDSPALFLERFGVLLAVNEAAHALWPDLSRADAGEVMLANRMASMLGGE